MGGVPRSSDLGSRLDRLERAVSNLQRQSTLSSASISEGNLTIRRGGSLRVIDGGSIIGEGEGNLDWEGPASFGGDTGIGGDLAITGNTEISGELNVTGDSEINGELEVNGRAELLGNTHIGGNLVIDGTTRLEGNLTFGPGSIPPSALSSRTEARTYSSGGEGNGNTRTQSLTVNVPSWAESVSVIAIGTSAVTAASLQILSRITISGNTGPEMYAASDLSVTVTATHGRTFSPGSSFSVSVFGGAQGTGSHFWTQSLVVMAVFTN